MRVRIARCHERCEGSCVALVDEWLGFLDRVDLVPLRRLSIEFGWVFGEGRNERKERRENMDGEGMEGGKMRRQKTYVNSVTSMFRRTDSIFSQPAGLTRRSTHP